MEFKLIGRGFLLIGNPRFTAACCVSITFRQKAKKQKLQASTSSLMNIQETVAVPDGFEIVESNKLQFYDNNKELLLLNIFGSSYCFR